MSWLSTPWVPVLAVAGALGLGLVAGIIRFLFRESRRMLALDRRLKATRAVAVAVFDEWEEEVEEKAPTSSLSALSVLSVVGSGVLRFASVLVPLGADERAKLAELLDRAGFRHRDALAVFLSLKLVLMLASGVIAGIVTSWTDTLGAHAALVGIAGLVGAVLGGLLPEAVLRRLVVRRRFRFARTLPDALDLMVLCVEAGHTFERALYMVSQELRSIAPDLAGELAAAEVELRVGAERRRVLQDLYERTGVEGLRDFAMTVTQAERYGTPIGQSIQNIAEGERKQRAARIEAAAGRLPVLMSLPMLVFVVPGILLLIGGPAFMLALEALKETGGP